MAKDYILSPKDEARLAAWHRQALERKDAGRKEGPCITISREFGCQAYPLAAELAKCLGEPWSVVDREILEEAGKVAGFSIEQIEKSRDTPPSLKAIFSMFLDRSHAEETELSGPLQEAMRKFAQAGHCIIVGCGGVFATREMKNAFHLRLVAPYSFRLTKIMNSHGMAEAQARAFIEQHQQQRDNFITRIAGEPLDDPLHYHMVLNNSRQTPVQMAAIIEGALRALGIGD